MTIAASLLDDALPVLDAPDRVEEWIAFISWTITLVAVLFAYALFLGLYFAPGIIHPDANGYWAQGSRIWQTGQTWFKPDSDAQGIGMHTLGFKPVALPSTPRAASILRPAASMASPVPHSRLSASNKRGACRTVFRRACRAGNR